MSVTEAKAALGGQLTEISHPVRNVATGLYPGGPTLQAGLQSVAELLGDRVRVEHAVTAAGLAEGWVEAGGQRFTGKAVLIASGTAPEHLPAAPDGEFGGDVTYGIESDPNRFAGKPVCGSGGWRQRHPRRSRAGFFCIVGAAGAPVLAADVAARHPRPSPVG